MKSFDTYIVEQEFVDALYNSGVDAEALCDKVARFAKTQSLTESNFVFNEFLAGLRRNLSGLMASGGQQGRQLAGQGIGQTIAKAGRGVADWWKGTEGARKQAMMDTAKKQIQGYSAKMQSALKALGIDQNQIQQTMNAITQLVSSAVPQGNVNPMAAKMGSGSGGLPPSTPAPAPAPAPTP